MDFNEIITFDGGLNTDDTPQSMPKGDYRDFSYCRLGYNSGNAFAVETSDGTIEITNDDIEPEDKVIGATQWLKENAIVYFVYKYTPPPVPPFPLPPVPHQIWVYYIATQTHELVVEDIVLNFSPDWPIFHANVVDDILKWTDGRWDDQMYEADGTRLFNPPYQINIRKALDGFYTIVDLQTIDAVKWPMEPPIVSYFTDTTRNDNKLRGKLFKFIIQPIYENGELGVWSMYSNLALPDQSELVSGTNWVFLNNDNVIRIQFDTGPKVIRGFNIAVQQFDRNNFGAVPPFGTFLQLNKDQDSINDNAFYTVNFYGGVATNAAIDVLKNYDRLPITADCQEYLPTNQLTYTNFREGYDKPTETPFILNVEMGYNVKEVLWNSLDLARLFDVAIDFDQFLLTYSGNNYGDVNTSFIFQVGDILQFVTWTDTLYTSNPYSNQRLFYSVSQEDVDTALSLPTFFEKNAYIMKLVGDSFIQQWEVQGYFPYPGTVSAFSTYGMRYSTYRQEGFNGEVRAASEQGSKVIVGGNFTAVANVQANRICRVSDTNGQVDPTFYVGSGFNNVVTAIQVQADGYIIVGGRFTDFDGVSRNKIARLFPDGGTDPSFNIGDGFNDDVYAIKIQPDGKILVGGEFTEFDGQPINLIARLNPDGTLDNSFTSPCLPTFLGSSVYAIELQSTNKIIIGGFSLSIPSAVSNSLARLNSDGTYDNTYLGNPNSAVFSISVITNFTGLDNVFIGGVFSSCNSSSRNRIARLDANGNLSPTSTFDPGTGFNDVVRSVVATSSYVYVCGEFTSYNGTAREKFLRLLYDGTFNADPAPFIGEPVYILPLTSPNAVWVMGNFSYTAAVTSVVITVTQIARFNQSSFEFLGGAGGENPSTIRLPSFGDWPVRSVDYDKVTGVVPSLKVGATHEFGVVYGDRAYRDGTVYTVESMNVFVPWFYDINERFSFSNPNNPFTITPEIVIKHIPPVWADRYWIVAKPATEILSFAQYVTNQNPGTSTWQSSVVLDSNNSRYKIYLDNYYVTNNKGANIRHEIKVGDKLRFKRSNYYSLEYLPYIELDIVDVELDSSGRTIVYTNLFQPEIISVYDDFIASFSKLFGQELEIYTPRPSVDDTGNIFISTWKDVTESIQIKNPHTEDRSHGSPAQYYIQIDTSIGVDYFYISGDQSQLNGTTDWPATIRYGDGSVDQETTDVTSAIYDSVENITKITLSAIVPDIIITYITLNGQDQVVSALTNITDAYYPIDYGDVYLRQRNNYSGINGPRDILYYFIEDFNYSDYFPSDIHNDGRFRFEDQNAKMVHRKASSIHSDSFILGTQINGLSSFALDNQNIEDMNPFYGEIVRTYMSGREGKTLKCLQPKRENSIYIQFYPNEVGSDTTVRVSNKTFASWFDYKSLFGCSDAGATALLPNGAVMYFDNNSGVFIYSGGNGQMIVSEIDPDTGKDYKFRTKTKELAKAYNESANPIVRTYINETVGEVGFAFSFDDEVTYEHVVFDYVNMRWRSTYDYNFRQFCNLGQTLVGWGKDNQLYLHNQPGEWTFHGDSFIQKVKFVSNENPLLLKRYQDITLISDDKFSIEAVSEPNRSYPLGMKTMMTENLLGMYEGYGKTNYRKNLYDPKFFVPGNGSTTNSTTWSLNGNQTALNGEMITIIQDSDKNIYTGIIDNPVYNSGPNTTSIEIVGLEPGTTGVTGRWYLSEKVLLNGEDVRANALTHTLSYDPAAPGASGEGSVLFSVGIKGVLS
jgi:uncharacterized delta-60 repeat protein